ncbi:MAG: thiamine biosynthesis protein ThiS [Deltaproteobacteria bacterium]|jgi:sulfur carrier protein ThiS|nr:thiamine biosynthesis protein ThiS [Deltaproteobacteria bacterium]
MKLTVSGEKKFFADNMTAVQLIPVENVPAPEYVSEAVCGESAEREAYLSRTLACGDLVKFLRFMGGGRL